jgi:hypothetical protein
MSPSAAKLRPSAGRGAGSPLLSPTPLRLSQPTAAQSAVLTDDQRGSSQLDGGSASRSNEPCRLPRTVSVVRTSSYPPRCFRSSYPTRFPEFVPPHDFRSSLPPTRHTSGTVHRRPAVAVCSLLLCVTLITDLSRFAPNLTEPAVSLPDFSPTPACGEVATYDANRPACPP